MTKRAFDLIVAMAAALLLAPLLLVLACAVRIFLGSPILFRQPRPGLHGRVFELVKFRTMTNATDPSGRTLPDEQRLTRFGRWLRSSSLDELPELWNVIKGDMSLVGPRPLLTSYMKRYSQRQARRHEVRPGITGWAQVNGRNALSWDEKFELDVWYVDNQSFWLDLKIIVRTVGLVAKRQGVAAEGHATMPEFQGTKNTGPPRQSDRQNNEGNA